MVTTILIIVAAALYMIPGFVFGIFAWDESVTSKWDFARRVLIHATMTVLWLPFTLWAVNPWSRDREWKEFFRNFYGTDEELRHVFGRNYDRMMDRYGRYIPNRK